jgi:ABC-type lipoprotein export system ATPase subunit
MARTFGGGETAVVAVHGATCTIEPGDRIALSGPSGSGKTTLLHLFAGLDEPTVGSITWPALGDRNALRPAYVGIVLQGLSLLAPLDVLENITLPLVLRGVDAAAAERAARTAMEQVGIEDLAGALPEELSGGQAERAAIARVVAARPRLILADEPTGQLDHASGTAALDALFSAVDGESALLISTHDPEVSARLDERWVMADGRLTTEQRCASR